MSRIRRLAIQTLMATALLFVVMALQACAVVPEGPRSRTYAWPAFRQDFDPETGATTTRAAGPFFDTTKRPDGFTQVNVRPFYSYTRDPVREQEEQTFFYPIGLYRDREKRGWEGRHETKVQILPFFYWNDVSLSPGHRELDYWFFPLVFGGNSSIEGSHFAVAPFGGNLKGVFGNDEIRFVMFPLFVELRRQGRVTYYLPFPIVKWGYGPGYRTYGVMPFFSRTEIWKEVDDPVTGGKKEIPVADRWTILWPLFRYDRDRMDRKYPREALLSYPFFGFAKTPVTFNFSMLFILNYPMFSYTRADLTDTTILDLFWPIFRFGQGKNFEQYRFWPLWDYSVVNGNTAISALWPIFWYFDEITPWYREERYQIFPIFFANFRRYLPEPDGTIRTKDLIRVWPFLKYKKDVDDTVTFEMLSLFPFNDEKFDRTYGPLFKFLTVRVGPKETAVSFMFDIFHYEEDPNHIDLSLAPLFHWTVEKQAKDRLPDVYGPQPGDVEDFNLLYGLLGYHHGPDDRYTRLFWGIKIRP
jgi:hypothetical protein